MRDKPFWIAVNSVWGMDPAVFGRLLDAFGTMEAAWGASRADLAGAGRLPAGLLENFVDAQARFDVEKELAAAKKSGTRIILISEEGYPGLLRRIPDPPPVLYARGGGAPDGERRVAMVGTRRCTQYGRDLAAEIAADLARAGVTVVSGLAQGIDTASHRGALAGRGETLAVLASAVTDIFPSSNQGLADEIAEKGLIVSEFSFREKPEKWNFIRRNRVISGMSLGTIVIEAPEKSGALITAEYARKQGRVVMAVPGNVKSDLSKGGHALIRGGAALVENAGHVLETLSLKPRQAELAMDAAVELDEVQGRVMEIINAGPCTFDEICAGAGMKAAELSRTLLSLEMRDLIRALPGKKYVRR